MTNELTVKEIAAAEDLHPRYIYMLAKMRGFPLPVRTIGQNLLYDSDQVAAFFAERAKNPRCKIAKRTKAEKHKAKKRKAA